MKKRIVAFALALATLLAFVPGGDGMAAAAWRASADGSMKLIVYMPEDGQSLYRSDGFSFEFDYQSSTGTTDPYYSAALYGTAANGDPDYGNRVKRFDISGIVHNNNRYVITLDISDVPAGNYYFYFALSNVNNNNDAVAADIRKVKVVSGTANEWVQYGTKWSYRKNGSWEKGKWSLISGKWYLFDAEGYMLTGWQLKDGKYYYLGSNGAMRVGWNYIGGKWYCMSNKGIMYSNVWLRDGGKWYMISKSGAMLTGWQSDRGTYYYMTPGSGVMYTGWLQQNGKWYYLNPNSGKMATGTVVIDGKTYTFNSSGVMQ